VQQLVEIKKASIPKRKLPTLLIILVCNQGVDHVHVDTKFTTSKFAQVAIIANTSPIVYIQNGIVYNYTRLTHPLKPFYMVELSLMAHLDGLLIARVTITFPFFNA
jgi:hypothetical protein